MSLSVSNSAEDCQDPMSVNLPEPNLVTNLLLIDDILKQLEKIKNENFDMITKHVSLSLPTFLFCRLLSRIPIKTAFKT